MPRYIQKRLDLVVTAEPGWLGDVPPWFASACSIGRVEMHLPVQPSLGVPHWRFSLLVLLPDKRLRRDPPIVLLGAQFLEEYRARARLEPAGGKLLLP